VPKKIDLTIRKERIIYKDRDGHGNIMCWVSQFHNAILQVRSIAWDGARWFVQPNSRLPYGTVSSDEVPREVKDRFAKETGHTID
jgi:hypothetical protein